MKPQARKVRQNVEFWRTPNNLRDEEGKFTFKNGSGENKKQSPAEILYGKKTREEKLKNARRNELLNKLGDNLTKAQVLYSSNEDLEKMLNENAKRPLKGGLSNTKISKLETNDKKFERNVNIMCAGILGTKIISFGKPIRTVAGGPDAAGMLNLSENKKLPTYTKDSTKLMNINDRKLSEYDNGRILKYRAHIEDKVLNQFKDFGYNLNDIEGRIFHANSAQTKRIKESDDFKEALIKNKEKILNGEKFTKRFTNYGFNRKSNLLNAFGSVDFLNLGFDNNNNLHLYMFDTYDFNPGENALVEAGRRRMLEGKLKGHFTLHDIIVTKQELDEIWNR